ncbi:hypothetical protein EVAR_50671_1 [Eumeta japonica]|uniref:Uncharacterized protein n=1 Tax=Eumeta variegata TaxID=151549 RepID=A0A4C1XS23_EUMVA|nr:hypothetical protein EVAR_50671_1 [Eumeta japonica]
MFRYCYSCKIAKKVASESMTPTSNIETKQSGVAPVHLLKEYLYPPLLSFLNTTTWIRPSKSPPSAISDDENTINIGDDNTKNVTKRKKKSNDAEDKMITNLLQR